MDEVRQVRADVAALAVDRVALRAAACSPKEAHLLARRADPALHSGAGPATAGGRATGRAARRPQGGHEPVVRCGSLGRVGRPRRTEARSGRTRAHRPPRPFSAIGRCRRHRILPPDVRRRRRPDRRTPVGGSARGVVRSLDPEPRSGRRSTGRKSWRTHLPGRPVEACRERRASPGSVESPPSKRVVRGAAGGQGRRRPEVEVRQPAGPTPGPPSSGFHVASHAVRGRSRGRRSAPAERRPALVAGPAQAGQRQGVGHRRGVRVGRQDRVRRSGVSCADRGRTSTAGPPAAPAPPRTPARATRSGRRPGRAARPAILVRRPGRRSSSGSTGRSNSTRTSRGPAGQASTGCGSSRSVVGDLVQLALARRPAAPVGPAAVARDTSAPSGATQRRPSACQAGEQVASGRRSPAAS